MPKAARERFTTPPAGTALAPMPRRVSGAGPLLSENRYVTVLETVVNIKVTGSFERSSAPGIHNTAAEAVDSGLAATRESEMTSAA